MGANDKQELIILLLLETRFHDRDDYHEMFKKEYNCDKINDRFNELLDKFYNINFGKKDNKKELLKMNQSNY